MSKFDALDYWGKIAIKLTEENRLLKEKIVNWVITLNTSDFDNNDAGMVRDEMIEFLSDEFTIKERKKNE